MKKIKGKRFATEDKELKEKSGKFIRGLRGFKKQRQKIVKSKSKSKKRTTNER